MAKSVQKNNNNNKKKKNGEKMQNFYKIVEQISLTNTL